MLRMQSILFLSLLTVALCAQSANTIVDISDYNTKQDHSDLRFLDDALAVVQVVGLGESTHGTREFNLVYLKMLKYLVEVHGFNTLFLEDDLVPCSRLDAYVKCVNNCDSISATALSSWPWKTREMNNIIESIRAYNEENVSSKISIVGVDVQDSKSISERLNAILKLSGVDTLVIPKVEKVMSEKKISKYRLAFSNQERVDAYKVKIELLKEELKQEYVTNLEYLSWNQLVSSKPKKGHLRDLAMGKNILSYLKNNPRAKGLFIAHNIHVFKYNEGKKNKMKNYVFAGGVLDKALSEKYYCIMQDFDKGCFNAYQRINEGEKDNLNGYELSEVCIEESVKESIGEALRDATKTMTFLTESELFSLSEEEYIKYHNIGAVFQPAKKNPKTDKTIFL